MHSPTLLLHLVCCLHMWPLQVSYATGDSLIRLLLNIMPIQQRLATMLLQKLPEFSSAECDEVLQDDDDGAAAGHNTSSLASLILGQLRW